MRWIPFRLKPALGMLVLLVLGCHDNGNGKVTRGPSSVLSLSASPPGLSIPAGGGGFATITVSRIGEDVSGPVHLTLEGAPIGVIGDGVIAANAQTGPLAIRVAANVTPQTLDTLTVKGAVGSRTCTAVFRLVITPPLPVGQLSPDLVQASGGTQRGGAYENAAVAQEPAMATTASDSTTQEVRHGFKPAASPN